MAHRSLSSLVLAGFVPTTAATLVSLLGDEGMPGDIRIMEQILYQPWESSRSGLLVVGMDPSTDLAKISALIQDRTTWWEVAVCLTDSILAYQPALLAQGAVSVLPHPEDDLTAARDQLRELLSIISVSGTELLGLELSDLIQLYGEKRVPKTIRISGDGVIGSMYLRDGMMVHADTMDEREGMEAFARLFRVKSPEIRVHNGCLTSRQSLMMPAMSVLLEGARVNDENARGKRNSGTVRTIDGANGTPMPSSDDVIQALGDIFQDAGGNGRKPVPTPVPARGPLDSIDEDLDI